MSAQLALWAELKLAEQSAVWLQRAYTKHENDLVFPEPIDLLSCCAAYERPPFMTRKRRVGS